LSATNAATFRQALKLYVDRGRIAGPGARPRSQRPASSPTQPSLYSQLSADEKSRFRAWADMATARRISDARVKSWEAAGKP
jgi:hypothetical protein